MNLTLYFRLIVTAFAQGKNNFSKEFKTANEFYDKVYFYTPVVYAKDGFNVSLQIHNGSYCESENGYRELGHTWEYVEFGFPSQNEELMYKYAETFSSLEDCEGKEINITGTVSRIPISIMEEVFEKHGGVDWEKTISIEAFNRLLKMV